MWLPECMVVLLHVEEVPESERVHVILCNTGKSDDSNIASNDNSAAYPSCCNPAGIQYRAPCGGSYWWSFGATS